MSTMENQLLARAIVTAMGRVAVATLRYGHSKITKEEHDKVMDQCTDMIAQLLDERLT